MYAVIFLSACVHEYIISLAFGYFYPILFIQFAILGCKLFENFYNKKNFFFRGENSYFNAYFTTTYTK
jgi:hypothetical protein